METLELKERWLKVPQRGVLIGDIKTDERFQPRMAEFVAYDQRDAFRNRSAAHVMHLRQLMLDKVKLDPILVANIDDELILVDGHHRLKATKALKRDRISARVLKITYEQALQASTLCNVDPVRRLAMEAGQLREALWRYLGCLLESGVLTSIQN